MGKRAVLYAAGLLSVSPLVYTEDVGTSGTLPAFQAGDPDCVLPEGLGGNAQANTSSPLLQVKSTRIPSAALRTAAIDPARVNTGSPGSFIARPADVKQQVSRRAQYGSQAPAAPRLGPLGPTGPGAARAAGQYASAPPAWSQNGAGPRFAAPIYPQRHAAAPSAGYPRTAAMPSFGAWPSAGAKPAPLQQPRRQAKRSRSGSSMGMGSGSSNGQSGIPRFSAPARQQYAALPPTPAPHAGSGYAAMPVGSANVPAVTAAVPPGWGPFGRPGYPAPMPMMPRPIPYGSMPYAAVAPVAANRFIGAVSPREAQLETQLQQMEQRLRDLEAHLSKSGGQRP